MLQILLLNAPCNGNGDVVFCIKISNYFQHWYKCKVTIATTQIKIFNIIGGTKADIIELKGNYEDMMCVRFKKLKFSKKIYKQDLIFVTPLHVDFNISYLDVKQLINYSNK